MFYIGGITEQAIGKPAPWMVMAVMFFSFAVRSVYMESCGMFVRGGVYVVVRDSIGPTVAKLSVSALVVDYVLTGPISVVAAGQYLGRLLNGFRAAPAAERLATLEQVLAPSFPPDRHVDRVLADAARAGRFATAASVNGAEQIVCATGFVRGYRADPLLSRLVDEHGLETAGHLIVLDPDSTVPALTGRGRTLALAGAPGQWAYPAADTLMGAKYSARRFLRRVRECRTH